MKSCSIKQKKKFNHITILTQKPIFLYNFFFQFLGHDMEQYGSNLRCTLGSFLSRMEQSNLSYVWQLGKYHVHHSTLSGLVDLGNQRAPKCNDLH